MKRNIWVFGCWVVLAGTLVGEEKSPIDPGVVVAEVGKYPLKVCVVSGEKLGDHGKPHALKQDGRDVLLCCKGCVKDFEVEPARYLKKLDSAVESQQRASYPLKECPVSLEKLGLHGDPVPVVVGNNTLVLLCCKSCRKDAIKGGTALEKLVTEARKPS